MRQNRREPVLPTLSGVSLLRSDDPTGPLASLAVDRLLTDDGPVWWADAGGHARTDVLARVAPSTGLLDRVRVARAFTATQHASLLRTLERRVTPGAALVVCPAIDALYRDGDLPDGEPADLLGAAADRLARIAGSGVPVLLTLRAEDVVLDGTFAAAALRERSRELAAAAGVEHRLLRGTCEESVSASAWPSGPTTRATRTSTCIGRSRSSSIRSRPSAGSRQLRRPRCGPATAGGGTP